jgi:hypothetical protein
MKLAAKVAFLCVTGTMESAANARAIIGEIAVTTHVIQIV